MNGLKKFFGLQSQSEKIKEYRDCLNQMDSIEQQTAALANAYALNKSQTDEILKSEDLSTKVRVAEQFKVFVENQTKDIQNLYLQRVKIEKSMSSLERDEDIADVLKDIKQLHDARHAYRTGAIKKSVYFDLLKAKSGGPVKFADVILWRGDKILILNRAGDGGSYTDEWCVPGGHVDAGESFRDAACRELCEETGIDLDKESLQEVAIYKNKDVDIHYFMGHITAEAPTLVRVDGMEEIGSAWINPVTEIEDYKFIFDMKDNLKRILGLEDQDHLVPLLKSFSKGKVSEKVVQDYLTNHPDALQKAENKHYFSHTERKDLAKKGEAMPNGKYPIRNSQDLHDAIRLVGRSSMPESEVKAWIKKRAKALGLTDELPDSWKEKVEKDFGDEVEKSFTEEERRELAKKGEAMPDGKFPIRNGHDLKNAIKLRNNSDLPEATVKAWIIKRAKALGLESELPEEWKDEKVEKGLSVTLHFAAQEEAEMFKSWAEKWNEDGVINVERINCPFENVLNDNATATVKDVIEKAVGHKYVRKEPDGKGGYNYIYEENTKDSSSKKIRGGSASIERTQNNPTHTANALKRWLDEKGIKYESYKARSTASNYFQFDTDKGQFEVRISNHTQADAPKIGGIDVHLYDNGEYGVNIDSSYGFSVDDIKKIIEDSEKILPSLKKNEKYQEIVSDFENIENTNVDPKDLASIGIEESPYGLIMEAAKNELKYNYYHSKPFKEWKEKKESDKKKSSLKPYTASNGIKVDPNGKDHPRDWIYNYDHLPDMTGKRNKDKRNALIMEAMKEAYDKLGLEKSELDDIVKAADTEDANQLSSEHLDPKQKKVPPVPDMYAQNVNLEKAKESEKQLFNTYLNFIEGAKTRIKNIHWGEEDNSKHVYLDDLTELVLDFEDLFSEAAQAGFGRFKDGEIQAEEVEEDDPVKIAWLIYNRTIELRKRLEEKELYWGEISYMDDFLVKLKQSVYRLQMH